MKHQFACPRGHRLTEITDNKNTGKREAFCPECEATYPLPSSQAAMNSAKRVEGTVSFVSDDAGPKGIAVEAEQQPRRLRADDIETLPPQQGAQSEATLAHPTKKSTRIPELPGYEIEMELGRGGMGVVYKAKQTKLNRTVALKMVLSGGHADSADLARFRIEAEAIARLQHPNIVQIHEIGEHESQPYYALEFVDGGSLAELLKDGPLAPAHAAQMVESIARAMHLAHSRNVVHRDLKPANILLTDDNVPKVSDFGLARQLDADSAQTRTGAVMGTPSYMAPEQASGYTHEAGPLADVYALGAILYACLTGKPPFRGKTVVDTLDMVRTKEPVVPSQFQKVPFDLETICLKCLQKEPEKRYASAFALAEDLRRFREGRPIIARPTSTGERFLKWVRRRPAVAGLLLLSILVVIALVVVVNGMFHNSRLQEALSKEEEQRQIAEGLKEEADKQRRLGRQYLYQSRVGLASRAWQEANIHRMEELLNQEVPNKPDDEDFRSFEWHYLRRTFQQHQQVLRGHSERVSGVAYSPDGKYLASASRDNTVRIWDVATRRTIHTLAHAEHVSEVAFSSDGRLASACHDGSVTIWDAGTGKQLHRLRDHKAFVVCIAWAADGSQLASGAWDNLALVYDSRTWTRSHTLSGHTSHVYGLCFSPDGKRIGSASSDRTVKVWDLSTRRVLFTCTGHAEEVFCVAWSQDGTRLVSGGKDRTVRVWNALNGARQYTLTGHTGTLAKLAFSQGDKFIISSAADGTVRLWNPQTGVEAGVFRGHTGGAFGLACSPDGRHIASGSFDKTIRIWDLTVDQESRVLAGHANWVKSIALSSDGKLVAIAATGKMVRVRDVSTGRDIHSLAGHLDACLCVAYSPNGQWLASAGRDRTVRIWNATTGTKVKVLHGHAFPIHHLAFSPDSQHLVSGTGTYWFFNETDRNVPAQIKVWQTRDWTQLRSLKGHKGQLTGLAFSPDGKEIATSSFDGHVKFWDPFIGLEKRDIKLPTVWPSSIAYHPKGKHVTIGSQDGTIQLWDCAECKKVLSIQGHTEEVFSVAYNPQGTRLASASHDGTVKLWEPLLGQELLSLRSHKTPVLCVAFSPDGHRLASGAQDRNVRIWDATPLEPR